MSVVPTEIKLLTFADYSQNQFGGRDYTNEGAICDRGDLSRRYVAPQFYCSEFERLWPPAYKAKFSAKASDLQKKIILYLGGISNGSCPFQDTMESCGLDYRKEREVGKLNAELSRLKAEGLIYHKNTWLYLTTKG